MPRGQHQRRADFEPVKRPHAELVDALPQPEPEPVDEAQTEPASLSELLAAETRLANAEGRHGDAAGLNVIAVTRGAFLRAIAENRSVLSPTLSDAMDRLREGIGA